jgi:glycerol-3-phosphate dehydrogenase (NAD(P)+)
MIGNRVAVVGAGAFGTALALAFARAGRDVMLWGRDGNRMATMADTRQSNESLPGVALEHRITPTSDLRRIADVPVVVMSVPTQALRQVCDAVALVLPPGRAVISAAKGIEQASGTFVTDVMADILGAHRYGILSGPSFAIDIARGLPTAISLAMAENNDAQAVAALLGSPALRIYHSTDIRGVEIGGAAKNVLAIAAGIVIGMQLGESARAAMIARGFAELRQFAAAYGARAETLMGLSGLGDLLLTASSPQSRNFSLGLRLGQGFSPGDAQGGKLAEGVFTAPILHQMALARGIDMPIVAGVTAVLAGKLSVQEALKALMARPFREE